MIDTGLTYRRIQQTAQFLQGNIRVVQTGLCGLPKRLRKAVQPQFLLDQLYIIYLLKAAEVVLLRLAVSQLT